MRKKILNFIFALFIIVPSMLFCVACDNPGDGSGSGGSGGSGGNTYVISFYEEYLYGEDMNLMCTVEATVGESVTFPTTEQLFEQNKVLNHDNSYYISEWKIDESWGWEFVDESYFSTYWGGDISIYANWEKKSLPINYVLNGGTNHPDNPLEANGFWDIRNPSRSGYKFLGWTYTDDTYNCPLDVPDEWIYHEINFGATLTAHWEQNRIVFHGNSETSGTMSSITYVAGEPTVLPTNTFHKNGCELIGWCEDRWGKGTIYSTEFLFNEDFGEIDMYAVWETGLDLSVGESEFSNEYQTSVPVSYIVTGVKEGYPDAYIIAEYNGCPITQVWIGDNDIIETLTFENDGLLDNGRVYEDIRLYNCNILVSAQVPKCITTLDYCYGNPKLSNLILHDKIKHVSNLNGCNSLEELIFSEGLESAFISGMSGLKKIYLPSTVTDYRLSNLVSIIDVTVPYVATASMYNSDSNFVDFLYNTENVGGTIFDPQAYTPQYVPTTIRKLTINGSDKIGYHGALKNYPNIEEVVIINRNNVPDGLLYGMPHLKKVSLNDEILTIGQQAFAECPLLQDAYIGNKVTTIGKEIFMNCTSLESVNSNMGAILPNTLTLLPNGMFSGCESITSIDYTVNDNTTIPDYFAYNCTSLTSFTIKDGIKKVMTHSFDCAGITDVIGEEKLTVVGDYAFARTRITSIDLSGVSDNGICSYAFSECKLLSTIVIPENYDYLGGRAFDQCSSIVDITPFKGIRVVESGAFAGIGITNLELWPKLEHLGSSAFSFCEKLTSVDLRTATKVTELAYAVFGFCPKLKSLYIPAHISKISGFFLDGSGVEKVEFDDECTATLASKAFGDMHNLKTVDIKNCTLITTGDSQYDVSSYLFWNCLNLESVGLNNTYLSVLDNFDHVNSYKSYGLSFLFGASDAFAEQNLECFEQISYYKDGVKKAYVPKSLRTLKITKDLNMPFVHSGLEKIIYESATIIENAFKDSSNLKTVESNTATSIYASAFEGCSNLENVNMPNLRGVGESVFKGCVKLKTITSNIGGVGAYAFDGCVSLESINLDNAQTVGDYAFNNCTSLADISSLGKVETIGKYSFANAKLTSLHFPNTLESIDYYAFTGNSELTSITFDEDCEVELNYNLFDGANNVTSIYIPDGCPLNYATLSGMEGLTFASIYLEPTYSNNGVNVWARFGGVKESLETLELRGTFDLDIINNEYIKHLRFINATLGTSRLYGGSTNYYYSIIKNLPALESIYIEGNVTSFNSTQMALLDNLSTLILGDIDAYSICTKNGNLSLVYPFVEEIKVGKDVITEAINNSKINDYLNHETNENFTISTDEDYYIFTKKQETTE